MRIAFIQVATLIGLCFAALGNAADFNNEIRPIFNKHCVMCHGGVQQAADLSLIYRDATLAVVEPGDPEASSLFERVTSDDEDIRMPPPDHGPPLTPDEISALSDWIRDGAKWESHWAYVTPQSQDVPQVNRGDWVRKPMDPFVLAQLQAAGLEPSGEATPERWLRRVSLDLVGLPPTPSERSSFLSSLPTDGEAAYEREVRRLLESPRFGERWASVWLDAVRYADSKGLGQDGRRSIWKYRDWVIDAFNRDMPFDEFTVAQLAGDLLPDPTLDDLIATACHRLTATNEEGGTDDEQFRLEAVIDRVNTTWQVWQGITFGCVQCHSHPYAPIRQQEYYEFLAYFNNTADTDLNSDAPVIDIPIDRQAYAEARELDRQIEDLKKESFDSAYALLAEEQNWRPLSDVSASSSSDTKLKVESIDGVAQFSTVGTVAKNTTIELLFSPPDGVESVTAIRFTGLPHNPESAVADSEWGFVLSHVELLLVDGDDKQPIEIGRLIGDEPNPFHDPQLSLESPNPHGYGAYSRIHHKRQAAFVLAAPVKVTNETELLLKLSHRIVETGAFPLVTRRGSIAVSDSKEFSQWLNDPDVIAAREKMKELSEQRAEIRSVGTPVMRERGERFLRPTHVFERGNFLTKGDRVHPKTPSFLPALVSDEPTRLHLAQWIIHPDNPLTARVTVNRFWAQMFGAGIVKTQEDFGSSGAAPSHPKLLDDLAVRFSGDMNWSVKELLREIALSATYRQSSKTSGTKTEQDPENRLLSRGPRSRLSAEAVRDQSLAISGLLSEKMFGPPVHPPLPEGVWKPFQGGDKWQTPARDDPDRYRRSIYTYTKRSIPFPMFAAFDAPSREFCSVRRLPSNTPLQALMTLNDPTFVEAAQALAQRMLKAGDTAEQRIAFGFLLATSREAKPGERKQLIELYEKTLKAAAEQGDAESIAMGNVATVLLNLDEVLCK